MKLNSYAAIEIDSLYAKLIIAEMNKGNIHIIAALKGLVEGYEDVVIIDDEAFLTSILSLLQLADHKYKIKIDEIILVLPNISHKVRMAGANMAIQTPMHLISMNEIKKIRKRENKRKRDIKRINSINYKVFFLKTYCKLFGLLL